jgi:hypothetical protein
MKLNLFLLSAAALVNAATATDTVELGTAGNYAILTKTGISTVPQSSVTGDIAVSPITAAAITDFSLVMDVSNHFSTSTQVTGNVYAPDYHTPTPSTLTTAVSDMETAYTDAAGRTDKAVSNLGGGDIGGLTLVSGLYTFETSINIAADITLDGGGDENAVFIIKTTGNVVQAANKNVNLQNGAQAKNIFWAVAGLVEVGAGAHMEGVLLVKTGVTFVTGSSLNGRILAQTACTLQMATIVEP